jgi:hypothetical protein
MQVGSLHDMAAHDRLFLAFQPLRFGTLLIRFRCRHGIGQKRNGTAAGVELFFQQTTE